MLFMFSMNQNENTWANLHKVINCVKSIPKVLNKMQVIKYDYGKLL